MTGGEVSDAYKEEGDTSFMLGDVDGSGVVNNRDAMILDRYIAGWTGYDKNIKYMNSADLDRNGTVNNRDAMILDRYIAGWDGYDKYIGSSRIFVGWVTDGRD